MPNEPDDAPYKGNVPFAKVKLFEISTFPTIEVAVPLLPNVSEVVETFVPTVSDPLASILGAFVIAFAPILSGLVAVPVQLSPHSAVVPLLLNTWPGVPACPAI